MNSDGKNTIKQIVRIIVFLLLLCLGAAGLYNVLKWKDTSGDYYSSLEQMYDLPDNIVDVAFFGPSIVYSGVNPAVLWEKDGIASFNAAISGQDREAAYYYIKEFVKKQSPKVVVVAGMLFQIDHYEVQGNIYRNTLSMRNSRNFIDVVNAVVPDNDKTETNTVWDYYLRWPVIHSRYKELKKEDFVPIAKNEKCLGYVYDYHGNGEEAKEWYTDYSLYKEITKENAEWVDKLVKLSEEEGFELLFVEYTRTLTPTEREDMNGNFDYLEGVGVKHVDLHLHADEMNFDYVEDMCDLDHPKASGAVKISSFLSDYLKENFDLEDRRGQSGYGIYDDAVEVYKHEKLSRELADCDDLTRIFELIGDGDEITYTVTLREGASGISEDTVAILKEYMPSRDIWYSGGTSVFNNGLVTEVLSTKDFNARLNSSEYLYVKPLIANNQHWDEVRFGSTVAYTDTGNFMVIYDKILDKIVLTRELY